MNERASGDSLSMFWFVAGGIAGAGLALLLTPHSGKAARRMMTGTVRGSAYSVRGLKHRMVGRGEDAWGGVASALSGIVARTQAREAMCRQSSAADGGR